MAERKVTDPKFIEFWEMTKDKLTLRQKYNALRLFLMTELTADIKVLHALINDDIYTRNTGVIIIKCQLLRLKQINENNKVYFKELDDSTFKLRMFFGLDKSSYHNHILIDNPYYKKNEDKYPDNRAIFEKKRWYEIPLRKKKPKVKDIQERFNLLEIYNMPFDRS